MNPSSTAASSAVASRSSVAASSNIQAAIDLGIESYFVNQMSSDVAAPSVESSSAMLIDCDALEPQVIVPSGDDDDIDEDDSFDEFVSTEALAAKIDFTQLEREADLELRNFTDEFIEVLIDEDDD